MSRVVNGRIKCNFSSSNLKRQRQGCVERAPTGILHWMPVLPGWFGDTSNWNDTLHLWNCILESNKSCDIFKKFGSSNKWIELSMVESKCHFYSKSVEFGFIP